MGAAHRGLFVGQQGPTFAMDRTCLHEAAASIFASLGEDVFRRLLAGGTYSWGWAGLGEREGDGRPKLHNSLSIYIDVIRVSLYEISERQRLTPTSRWARSASIRGHDDFRTKNGEHLSAVCDCGRIGHSERHAPTPRTRRAQSWYNAIPAG